MYRESVPTWRARKSGKPSLINVWVDPDAYAPGTMNQTMYK
jgi:acetolactate synthase-1/2/3 large subunit